MSDWIPQRKESTNGHVEPLVLAVSEQLALSHSKCELCAIRRGKMESENDPFGYFWIIKAFLGFLTLVVFSDEEVIRDQLVGEALATCQA